MMAKGSAIFLQFVVVLIGIVALALLLWEPQLEGVNALATNFEIYTDSFILLVYAGSIPFFIALFQVFKLLRNIGQDKVFSQNSVRALQTIKYCAFAIIGFVVVEEIIVMLNHGNDDAAGAFMIGILITFGSIVVAVAANLFERLLQSAIAMKIASPSGG